MASLIKPYRIGILLLLVTFGTISAVILTPALPQLSQEFGISETKAQMVMSIFLIGYTIGQLPYGPIANRFGRKKAIYAGIGLMIFGSLLAVLTHAFWALLASRFIQALGAAVGLKITFTMISDQHEGQEAIRAISLLSFSFALMPLLGVTIGGYLIEFWGWRSCFVFSSIYAILLAFLVLALPETSKKFELEALRIKKIAHAYLQQFKSAPTVLNALMMGLVSSNFYIFATLAPYIGINTIGLSPKQFGLWNLLLCLGLFGSIFFTRWFAGKDKPRLAMFIGISIMAFGAAAMLVSFAFSFVNVWTLFFLATVIRGGVNPIWSNASSNGLSVSHDKSNTSAVMQFINLGISTAGLLLVSLFPTNQIMLLPITSAVLIVLLAIVWKQLYKS